MIIIAAILGCVAAEIVFQALLRLLVLMLPKQEDKPEWRIKNIAW